ncbi:YeeE/YedE thiosulfate transporter family protein [Geosporobacter ferrireducens]|uniref:Transporter n=1 Tax=Geosporobacter ferrireducens TaxID=1424294 RepID=A0A1D8GET2_9FIRM|nr:YeeE/YedE thiosulfate transporter family protein [Geosporobacter ferrireducens]AOT69407.1 transporter [Geosporobacter ferrireducens]MTI56517.1 transporter [Geosporobacter ferrireducens]
MSESNVSSRTSSRRREGAGRKPKKKQQPYGIALLVGVIAFGIYLSTISAKLTLFWILGCCFGVILQKSRFCFTASMRDPYLTGSTSVTRAVLIAFAVTTIGFTAIKYGYYSKGLPIPGQGYVVPISLATAVGALLFGIGMVIAGGCASGTLMRVGEGFTMQILSLIFFVIGSLWGAHDYGWWKLNFMLKGPTVFLPDLFGWFGAVAVQLLLIAGLYILADKWENRNQEQ